MITPPPLLPSSLPAKLKLSLIWQNDHCDNSGSEAEDTGIENYLTNQIWST